MRKYANKILAEYFTAEIESRETPELTIAAEQEIDRINQELRKWMPRLRDAYEIYRPQVAAMLRKYAESCTFPFENACNFGDPFSDTDITHAGKAVWTFGDSEMKDFLCANRDVLIEALKPLRIEFTNEVVRQWLDFTPEDLSLWELHELAFRESQANGIIDDETYLNFLNFSFVNCAIHSNDGIGTCHAENQGCFDSCLPSEWNILRGELPPDIACLLEPFTN